MLHQLVIYQSLLFEILICFEFEKALSLVDQPNFLQILLLASSSILRAFSLFSMSLVSWMYLASTGRTIKCRAPARPTRPAKVYSVLLYTKGLGSITPVMGGFMVSLCLGTEH